MRIAEGEDEHILVCFVGKAVPRKKCISTEDTVVV